MIERPIELREIILLQYLLNLIPGGNEIYPFPESVIDLDDGGMGSIRFGSGNDRKYRKDLIQVNYIDVDKVLVIITLIVNDQQELFELEMWKVDFNEIKQYPTPDRIILN